MTRHPRHKPVLVRPERVQRAQLWRGGVRISNLLRTRDDEGGVRRGGGADRTLVKEVFYGLTL